MPNYQLGKIYCIRSDKTDDIYLGSTAQPYLSQRFSKHKSDYRGYLEGKSPYLTSFEIIQYGDAYIELICDYPCNSKADLNREEGKYQREMKCVNKIMAGRTSKEYRDDNKEKTQEYMKKYRNENNQVIKEKKKEYYNKNNEVLIEKAKKYRNDNKETIKEKDKIRKKIMYEKMKKDKEKLAIFNNKNKEWREKNKKKLSEIHICECGSQYRYDGKSRHQKSKKHKNYINEKKQNDKQTN